MKNQFTLAFNEIMNERALSREVVLQAIEQALVNAYKRDAKITTKQHIEASIDQEGRPHIYVEKEVVDDVMSEQTEVSLDVATEHHPDAELGDMVMVPVTNTSSNFGRIAAQTAKQVILQRIREAERETLYDEFIEREGDLITGTVQSVSSKLITLSLGRAEAIMPRQHQIRGERYKAHDKVRTYVVEVNKSSRGPQIIVSRTHKDMLRRLLEYEVPEVYNGQVEIKNIAREAGQRSKVAVVAVQDGIDPVGACVGMRGMRIQNIIKELNNEKIDVIEWDDEPKKFISKALSPARVSSVFLDEDIDQPRTATVIVPDDQLSLAIGKEGQNARLAAKLTTWRIDIKSLTEAALENQDLIQAGRLTVEVPEGDTILEEAERIIEKKRNNRPIMPEEFNQLGHFVEITENTKQEQREIERSSRRDKLDSVRDLVPEAAFTMPISTLELADDINQALRNLDSVGELMVRILSEEDNLVEMLQANNAEDDAMDAIRYALDDLVIPELDSSEEAEEIEEVEESAVAEEVVAEATADVAEEVEAEEVIEDIDEDEEGDYDTDEDEDEELDEDEEDLDELVDDGLTPEMWPEDDYTPRSRRKTKKRSTDSSEEELGDWESDYVEEQQEKKSKKKSKRRKVQLIYDEELGEVVSKRRRKGSRRRNDYDDFEDFDL